MRKVAKNFKDNSSVPVELQVSQLAVKLGNGDIRGEPPTQKDLQNAVAMMQEDVLCAQFCPMLASDLPVPLPDCPPGGSQCPGRCE